MSECLWPPLLPVIDLLDGDVVWGIAGRRESYAPIDSPLVRGSQPVDVARALRTQVGHDLLYVADLDAIQTDEPQWDVIGRLIQDGGRLIVDAGVCTADRAGRLLDLGVFRVVVALETLPDWQSLEEMVRAVGGVHLLFSLDLKEGQPLTRMSSDVAGDPISIGNRAIECGAGGLIVLDLAGVGADGGVPTAELCRTIRDEHPGVLLITGGGVRKIADVDKLLKDGVDSVLVASALHRQSIGADEIALLKRHVATPRAAVRAESLDYPENGSNLSGAS